MKWIVLLLASILIASSASAADVIVFIHEEDIGSPIGAHDYLHPNWVQWPASDGNGTNRLLSPITGQDWRWPAGAFDFRPIEGGGLVSADHARLLSRGHFEARAVIVGNRPVFALARPDGTVGETSALYALRKGSHQLKAIPWNGDWPLKAILVYDVPKPASGRSNPWNEVASIVDKSGGRVLAVELPQSDSSDWTRLWFRGQGWPPGVPISNEVGVPGALPSREILKLLTTPSEFKWSERPPERWGGADRWRQFVRRTGPVMLAFVAAIAIYAAGCAAYYILKEERGRFAAWLMRFFFLTPAMALLAGNATAFLGLSFWPVTLAGSAVALAAIAGILSAAIRWRWPDWHPFGADALVGLVVVLTCDPAWSFFNHGLAHQSFVTSPEAAAALLIYTTTLMASLARAGKWARWLPVALALAMAVAIVTAQPWWSNVYSIPLAALLAAYGWIRWPILAALALTSNIAALPQGFCYAPSGLISDLGDADAVNLYQHLRFLGSPTLLLSAVIAATVYGAMDKFFFRQLRRATSLYPHSKALFSVALAALCMGILQPIYLYSALGAFLAAFLMVLFDALRTP